MPTSSQEQSRSPKAEEQDDGLLHRAYGITVDTKTIDETTRSVEVVASSDAIDSYDEYIEQGSWNLKRFEANPVVLYAHNSIGFLGPMQAKDTLPIGHAEQTRMESGQLVTRLFFVNEKANPMGEMVWQGFLQKSIRAVSVGFRPRTVKVEKRDGIEVYRLADCELFEISVCPMGANPEAVAKMRQRDINKLRALASRCPDVTDNTSTKETPMPEHKSENNDAVTTALIASHEKAIGEKAAALTKAEETITAQQKAINDLNAKLVTLSAEKDALSEKLTASQKECVTFKEKAIEMEVEDLIGKKFVPAQKDAMLDLAKSDKKSFDAIVASTPLLPMLKGQIIKDDPKASNGKSNVRSLSEGIGARLQEMVPEDDDS